MTTASNGTQDLLMKPLAMTDVPALTATLQANRGFLAPWVPLRPEGYLTQGAQEKAAQSSLASDASGTSRHLLITHRGTGQILGSLNINSIIRGAFQSASIGYWVVQDAQGQGIASWAVSQAKELAFGELKLHRLQGETLVHNAASRRVLTKNGFDLYGLAADYLKIAGKWQEHALYQLLHSDPT